MHNPQSQFAKINLISTTLARKNIAEIINKVAHSNVTFAIGRRNKIEALIIKPPEYFNENLSFITNYNANSGSFKFLEEEPDLYSVKDLRKKYVR